MAASLKNLKIETPHGESDTSLKEVSQNSAAQEKTSVADSPKISFDPRPVVLPFKKTLYALAKAATSDKVSLETQNPEQNLDPSEAQRRTLNSALSTALVYGIPVAMICFLLGIRIGMACMKSTHGSSLEILWEALKF